MEDKIRKRVADLLAGISELSKPDIKFNLTGKCAGMYERRGDKHCLRFNRNFFEKNFEDVLKFTVPHEVAHYVTVLRHGWVKPHGKEWKNIMGLFGIKNPQRCHKFDVSHLYPWKYKCACREHYLSSFQHAKAANGRQYCCHLCKKNLTFVG